MSKDGPSDAYSWSPGERPGEQPEEGEGGLEEGLAESVVFVGDSDRLGQMTQDDGEPGHRELSLGVSGLSPTFARTPGGKHQRIYSSRQRRRMWSSSTTLSSKLLDMCI